MRRLAYALRHLVNRHLVNQDIARANAAEASATLGNQRDERAAVDAYLQAQRVIDGSADGTRVPAHAAE